MTKTGFERLERYPIGSVWLKMEQVVAMSHAEQSQRVLILKTGEKVMIRDTVANVVAVLGELPAEEGRADA